MFLQAINVDVRWFKVEFKGGRYMFCSEYEMTECGTKLCCYDCDNEKCEKRCTIEKSGCDCLCESEPVPFDERYTETQLN